MQHKESEVNPVRDCAIDTSIDIEIERIHSILVDSQSGATNDMQTLHGDGMSMHAVMQILQTTLGSN